MVGIVQLWLPIVLSAVIVFVISSIIHMASPWHKGDYPRVPNEDQLRSALRPLGIPPGDYMVPRCASHAESPHAWPSSEATTEQFSGRSCIAKPYGSALRNRRPSRSRISYL